MLYIFRVDTGTMIQLEMNLALETVTYLKQAVANTLAIPIEKQVLLISGGEALELDERVCKYTAGSSDTNPIFLFSMASLESAAPPPIHDTGHDKDLQPEVESTLSLPDTHNTVAVRATLAQEYVKISREQFRRCELLILDQHLQHQGWAAALANLEDSVTALEKRRAKFEESYVVYLASRDHNRRVIETFDDDLHVLSKIPVLPALMDDIDSGCGNSTPDGSRPASASSVVTRPSSSILTSLLDWIQKAGNNSLEQMADSCYRSLEQLDQALLDQIKGKINNCVEGANSQQMKEIRGLGDRLAGLEQLAGDAKQKVGEQTDLAAAFLQNQARASGLRDNSILPDLCASHRHQLAVMMRNHQHILSIKKRCAKAKEELSFNLYTRLKWVMYIQGQILECGQKIMLYNNEIIRLTKRMEVIDQLHLAPSIYLATIVEVVRRRAFSDHFLQKAGVLAENFNKVHREEMTLRNTFQSKLNKHFLSTMFPGMEDMPPSFATEAPHAFDELLPKVTLQDLEKLRGEFPELAESLSVPDRNTLSFLLTRSFNQTLTPEEDEALYNLHGIAKKIAVTGAGNNISVSVINRIITDGSRKKSRLEALAASRERDLESETDTDDGDGGRGRGEGKVGNGRGGEGKGGTSKGRTARMESRREKAALNRSIQDKNNGPESLNNEEFVTADFEQENEKERVGDVDHVDHVDNVVVAGNLLSSSDAPSSGTTNTSAAPSSSSAGSGWPSQTDLRSQVEDKNREISDLRLKLGDAETKLESVETKIGDIIGVNRNGLESVRTELAGMKSQVDHDRTDVLSLVSELTKTLVESLKELEEVKLGQAEKSLRDQSEKELETRRQEFETMTQQLEDCHREIDIYRGQLEESTKALDKLQSEMLEASEVSVRKIQSLEERRQVEVKSLEVRLEREINELKQQMVLEHELEFDNFKQNLQKGEITKNAELEDEVRRLKKSMAVKEEETVALKNKLELTEAMQEEKIQEEKDRIVHILEAAFSERKKMGESQLEENLKKEHVKEVEKVIEKKNEEMHARLDELRDRLVESSKTTLERCKAKMEEEFQKRLAQKEHEFQAEMEEERDKFEKIKADVVDEAVEKMRKKSKLEMETLRSRVKVIHSAGALTRSPSVSESDISIEIPSPRDSVDEATVQRWEERLGLERRTYEEEKERLMEEREEERRKFEQEAEALVKKHEAELHEQRHSDRLRQSAEKQVMFNEAIRAAVDEKERQIDQLTSANRLMEASTLRDKDKQNSDNVTVMALQEQLADIQRQNARLESELRDARRIPNSPSMASSISTMSSLLPPDESLRLLQEENLELKSQLSKSMCSLVTGGKVSITSADKGEIVLICWADDHNNYAVYHEGSVLHFLHTESIESLGLHWEGRGTIRKKYITAEVVEKEYCQAKKPQNRFRVAEGTKFYRVKCKPVDKDTPPL